MYVRIYAHFTEKGKEAEGRQAMAEFAGEVEKSPDVVAVYKMVGQNDPTNITTASVWTSEEAWQKWTDARKAAAQSGAAEAMTWAKVEGGNFETF